MPQKMRLPIVAAIDKFILVLFNTDLNNDTFRLNNAISLQRYDTTRNSWSFLTGPPAAITETVGANAVTYDHRMFVVCGWQRLNACYNNRYDTWTLLSSPSQQHMYGSAAITSTGNVLICGGVDRGKPTDTIEIYDVETATWHVMTGKLPEPLWNLFCCVLKETE